MGSDKPMKATSSSPPIFCDYATMSTGKNTCQAKEAPSAATVFCTKLRKHFTQIKNHTHPGRRCQYQKLNNVSSPSAAQKSAPSTRSRLSSLMNLISITTLVLVTLITTASANPVFVDNPSLAQFQSGRNIRHLPCIVRKSGRSGVCMFAIDCIKQNGTHLGTCIDRFYFGSCCDIKDEGSLFAPEIGDNSIDQNTISHHYTSESTTMPTSALFKLTTLGPHIDSNTTLQQPQADLTQISNIVTQTMLSEGSTTQYQNTRQPVTTQTNTTAISSTKPSTTSTAKPPQSTTHKQSHFVIRTTAKPAKGTTGGGKPLYNTTTKKKKITTTTTTTTTPRPILTTTASSKVAQDELTSELNTPPTKLFTFQTVETTVATPTEPTKLMESVTTQRPNVASKTTKSPQLTVGPTNVKNSTSTTAQRPITKPKPQTSRKPSTTKKPQSHKRTTAKPTNKPLPTTMADQMKQQNATTTSSSSSSTTTHVSTTTANATITKYPGGYRPKPKPTVTATATVTKVPRPTTTSFKPRPKPTTTTNAPEELIVTTSTTTDATKKVPATSSTSSSSSAYTTTTTTTSTTKKPQSTTKKTTTTTTTTIPPPVHQSTTDAPEVVSTTQKPGLVTWTNIDAEPADPNKASDTDWMPVTTAGPNANNKTEESLDSIKYEEVGVSVITSISAVVNNNTVFVSPPQKPIIFQLSSSTSTTTTTSTTRKPVTTTSTSTTTTTTAKPTTTSTTTTTTTKSTTTTTHKPPTHYTTPTTTTSTTEKPTTPSTATPSTPITSTTTTSKPSSPTIPPSPITEAPFAASSITPPQPPATDIPIVDLFTTESPESLAVNVSITNSLEGVDYRQVCGRRMFPEPRIVGGSNAAFGRWPWQISLRQWRTSTYLHKCGAALLNENWAITAAHCVDNVPPSDLLLRLGEYDLAEEEEPYGYQERRVQIVASHPQFDPRTFEYDLALLRFYEPVTFQPNIIPVCVPDSDEDFIGQTAFVTGWGRLYEDGPLPSVLQEVAVPVINNTICESMYRSAGYIEHIPHIFICAGWKKGGYDSCEGDSGGPMVLQRESDKRFQLGGVISWGIGCAEANQPGVYTRISEFRDWINQILQF
ncbi:serine proteinase stubble [Musca domestica]|uniref:Serine proteinase stubble n=1 Tax=Musca domestica TaxID=7370 RepID=A0A1I8ML48_MUSDO|nr:serine proteinase stubble [Musca domestica]XP_019895429.1 serine proteinase stubble [Musca domestica]